MMVVGGPGGDQAGAQFVRLRVRHFERRDLLQMLVQQPGVVEQHFQDQGFSGGERRALAAEQVPGGELGTCSLVGTGGNRQRRSLCKTSAAAAATGKIAAALL